jgi:hypothetical protein
VCGFFCRIRYEAGAGPGRPDRRSFFRGLIGDGITRVFVETGSGGVRIRRG